MNYKKEKNRFVSFERHISSTYEITPYCAFCKKKTDEMLYYNYYGSGIENTYFPFAVHRICYYKNRVIMWILDILSFFIAIIPLTLIESAGFYRTMNIFTLPIWLNVINFILSFTFVFYVSAHTYDYFTKEIYDYKNSHTDFEDHYKSDRLRWRR